jgi:hypothetical protein
MHHKRKMKLITKTPLLLLLTAVLIVQAFTAVPISAAETDTSYKTAYYNLIKELHKGDTWSEEFDRFQLIYVDNDNIPELLAVDTPSDEYDNNGTYRYEIYTYYDGQAVLLGCYASGVASAGGYRGDTMYIKKSGKIYETYFSSGSGDGEDIIYSMKDGELTEIARGSFNVVEEEATWMGKTMSRAKYSKKFNKVFKVSKGKSLESIKTVSYKSMKKKLK